jgi:hypothetical protein
MEFKGEAHPDILLYFMNKEIKGAWDLKVKSSAVELWIK